MLVFYAKTYGPTSHFILQYHTDTGSFVLKSCYELGTFLIEASEKDCSCTRLAPLSYQRSSILFSSFSSPRVPTQVISGLHWLRVRCGSQHRATCVANGLAVLCEKKSLRVGYSLPLNRTAARICTMLVPPIGCHSFYCYFSKIGCTFRPGFCAQQTPAYPRVCFHKLPKALR